MSNKANRCALVGAATIWLLTQPLVAQEAPILALEQRGFLTATGASQFLDPDRCDDEGNIFREWIGPTGPLPVTKISDEGKVVATFSLDAVPNEDIRKAGYRFYTVDLRGSLYALSLVGDWQDSKILVVKFKQDGTFDETTELKGPGSMLPYHLAVFPTGDYLLSAVRLTPGSGGTPSVLPYTAIFDATGKLATEIDTTQAVTQGPDDAQASAKTQPEKKDKIKTTMLTVGRGDALIGADGNAYLIQNSTSPVVFVVSSAGQVVRRMVLQSPDPNLEPAIPRMAAGRLVVPYARVTTNGGTRWVQIYSVYDALTGDHLMDYRPPADFRGHLACYTRRGTFLFTALQPDGRMALLESRTR
jgi:hypothetical protein